MAPKVKTGIVTIGLLLLLIITLKVADYGVTYFFSSNEKTPIDSTAVWKSHGLNKDQFDSVYTNIEKVVVKSHKDITDKKSIDSLTHLVKIAEPVTDKTTLKISTPSKNWVPDTTFLRDPSTTRFYLVTSAGYITDKHGTVEYFLPAYDQRYYYELVLHKGTYTFQSLSDHDTIPFIIDRTGVYKLGFQEDHPNFIILKDSL